MDEKGYLAPEELSAVFRMMRSNDLIWNFVVNNYLLGRDPPAFDLMHWSVDGTRLPRAMQEYYLYNMYVQNNLSKPGALNLLGTPIDLSSVRCPAYFVAGAEDHIVPWQTAYRSARLLPGASRFVLGRAGHITAVVCPTGGRRNQYLAGGCVEADADAWLAAHGQPHAGSWWPDWTKWLRKTSGKRRPAPTLGNRRHPPITAAPGQYVLEG
jgi:polyhydroxyalkanoate synthase